jgi:hypothetical protein
MAAMIEIRTSMPLPLARMPVMKLLTMPSLAPFFHGAPVPRA